MSQLSHSLILCGFPSSGKSRIGRRAARILGVPFVDTDEYLNMQHHQTVQQLYQADPQRFRDLEHEAACAVSAFAPCVISTGGGMLTFERNADVLRSAGWILLIDRPFPLIWTSLQRHPERPLIRGKSMEDVREMYDRRMEIYQRVCDLVIPNDQSPEACARLVVSSIPSLPAVFPRRLQNS
ncbi:MAG: shikimate kinase [Clostridia bacterium]|nr:shikimate kinase [Clostridia bacterium]MBQ9290947.1 shikimate kinase [Clostridia bacterium]